MDKSQRKSHWENIYQTKNKTEVSWFQKQANSLPHILNLKLDKTSGIIDIGSGDSVLINELKSKGFKDISVLDISKTAIERAKINFIGDNKSINWIVADVIDFTSNSTFDLWHDRAVFHFLTDKNDVNLYVQKVRKYLKNNGYLMIQTFSKNGPVKCSGIEIIQYDIPDLVSIFNDGLKLIHQEYLNHQTPFNTQQNFSLAIFKRV